MPSIQNSAETLDFLGTIGSTSRGDDPKLSRTAKVLVQLAQFLIDTATANLERGANVASGQTASSMKVVNLNVRTVQMSCDVQILSTYKFLDQGVKGVDGGSGKFSFKTRRPSKKMATAILKWARKRGMAGKIKYKAKSANEAKNQSIRKATTEADNLKSMAYAMAASIKKKGIRPTGFFTKAVVATRKEERQRYGKAFKLDIIEAMNSLNKN